MGYNNPSLTIWVYLISFSCYYMTLQQFKVIQGHRFWVSMESPYVTSY